MTAPSAGTVRLVEAGVSHAPVLAALHAACFADPWPEAEVVKLLAVPGTRAVIAVAGAGDTPAGFALFRTVADEGEIISLGVVPAWRRRGVGLAILRRCHDAAAAGGAARMVLEVAETNRAALALYGALGYAGVGHRAGYYRGRDGRRTAARVLACDLTGA